MERAMDQLSIKPQLALIDGNRAKDFCVPVKTVIHGDSLSANIAAASVLAKVTRDDLMQEMAETYPQYGFEIHKGYGTKAHYEAIKEFLKPIIIVFNGTFGLEETLGFVKYYYDNQSKYPKQYQLTEIQKELIDIVVKEELTRENFCSSCGVLIRKDYSTAKSSESFIDINATERTEFMVEKAFAFLGKIALSKTVKDSSLEDLSIPREYQLTIEREDCLERQAKKGYALIIDRCNI